MAIKPEQRRSLASVGLREWLGRPFSIKAPRLMIGIGGPVGAGKTWRRRCFAANRGNKTSIRAIRTEGSLTRPLANMSMSRFFLLAQ